MTTRFPHSFSPIQVGHLALSHRIVVPPHGGGNGNLLGTEAEFEQHCAMWLAKVNGGVQWVGGGPNFVGNRLPLGFEVTGVGAHGPGFFRNPAYPERIGEFARRVHGAGGYLSVQMVQQGGMPAGPSATFSGHNDHRIAHALDADEVRRLIAEYAESAAIALRAGIDTIEIHANHDDVVEWFMSPATNHRTDAYGGSFENRRRLLREIVDGIRASHGGPFTFGLRLCLDQYLDGGIDLDECRRFIEAFTADGVVDYFSLDVGNNWNSPSYVPSGWHDDAEWAALCGQAKQATSLPVIYAGRVTTVEQAEAILAAGHADLVGMARATMADPTIVRKAQGLDPEPLRPCIGLNECIHRKQVESLPYACGVNVTFAREAQLADLPRRSTRPAAVLVVGGGPAGTELAALCAEHGHRVQLWEKRDHLGGMLAVAAMARANATYQRWIDYQADRLRRAGVEVHQGRTATTADALAAGADHLAVATGSTPRRPRIPGVDQPHVVSAGEALRGAALGEHVVVVAEDDGPAPMSVADHLAARRHRVTLVFQTAGPAPLVGKYSLGSMLARLVDGGVQFVPLARVAQIDGPAVVLRSTLGAREWRVDGVDSVVLATGSIPDDSLYLDLKHQHPSVHLLGDAFAPRRVVFATRQAFALAVSWL